MKRSSTKTKVNGDDILPEYDFSRSSPNKYASQYATGSTVVVLEPDVAAAFPTAGQVNEALRGLIAQRVSSHRPQQKTS